MPVRSSTSLPIGAFAGISACAQSNCTPRSAARTRVSTAMSLGFAPRARHSTICATAAAANSSGAPRAVVRAGAPEGFAARIVFGTRTRL